MLESPSPEEKRRRAPPTKNSIRATILGESDFASGRETLESMVWKEMNGDVGKALQGLLNGRLALRVAHADHVARWAKGKKTAKMTFALDGRLVGDIGELIAAEVFDLELLGTKSKAVDAETSDSRRWRVQIKAPSRTTPSVFDMAEITLSGSNWLKTPSSESYTTGRLPP